jgi:hypothetical protein
MALFCSNFDRVVAVVGDEPSYPWPRLVTPPDPGVLPGAGSKANLISAPVAFCFHVRVHSLGQHDGTPVDPSSAAHNKVDVRQRESQRSQKSGLFCELVEICFESVRTPAQVRRSRAELRRVSRFIGDQCAACREDLLSLRPCVICPRDKPASERPATSQIIKMDERPERARR